MPDRDMLFNVILNCTIELVDGRSEYPLYEENDKLASSDRMTSVYEENLVKWMLCNDSRKECFFKGVIPSNHDYFILQAVPNRVLVPEAKDGDIDILVFPKDQPDQGIAFEVKRVKVTIDEKDVEDVNKDERAIKKGIKQTNYLHKHGFHQTYLVILIVTDGQNRTTKDMPFRYADSDRIRALYDLSFNKKLNKEIGVIFVHISEPSSASIDFMGHFATCLDKRSAEREQSVELTERLRTVKMLHESTQRKSV
jgi:hypothetical protein